MSRVTGVEQTAPATSEVGPDCCEEGVAVQSRLAGITSGEDRFRGSAAAKGEGPGTEAECVTFSGTSNPSTGPNSLGYQFAYAACIRLSGRVSQAQRGDTFFYWFALMNGLKQSAEPLDPNRFQRYGGWD